MWSFFNIPAPVPKKFTCSYYSTIRPKQCRLFAWLMLMFVSRLLADMFCFQCEQTRLRKGCTTVGVCGKTPEVASIQDLLVHAVKGMSLYSHAAKELGAEIPSEIYDFTFSSLFRYNNYADRLDAIINTPYAIHSQCRLVIQVSITLLISLYCSCSKNSS